ncbi:sodium:calcium antiporter [bacterium]|nr:sodium:calcium antiporter [bacterium]
MTLAAAIIYVAVGFGVLLYAGDCIVRGALATALKINLSPLLVGIVVVGLGTSLPEIIISAGAAFTGRTGLAQGAIIGSNIANVWLVLAIPAMIFPMVTTSPRMRLTAIVMLAATFAWIGLAASTGLNPAIGLGMLGALAVYLIIAWSFGRRDLSEDTPEEIKLAQIPAWRVTTLVLIGVVGLPLGAQLLIDGGIAVAAASGLSHEAIGLTILAVGSSLPELGAGLAAAWRKQSDVAMGNILGSNIFNILGAGGLVALAGPQVVSRELINYSHWALGASAVMITVLIFARRRVGWVTSPIFIALYCAYIAGLIYNWSFADAPYLLLERPPA